MIRIAHRSHGRDRRKLLETFVDGRVSLVHAFPSDRASASRRAQPPSRSTLAECRYKGYIRYASPLLGESGGLAHIHAHKLPITDPPMHGDDRHRRRIDFD
jgi:hypothetical protein